MSIRFRGDLKLKRFLDITLATFALFLSFPFLVILALAIKVNLGSPVLFRQTRPGLRGAPFNLIKFRTMRDIQDATGASLPDDLRLTRFGKFLRVTSLDELPELINVLKGEMSIVGPRPLLMQYLPLYSKEQARRHEMRPGLTGWAQVNGRNAISWLDKFKYDVWYIDHWNILLDVKIIFMTFSQVFAARGITEPGHVTMSEFRGSPEKE